MIKKTITYDDVDGNSRTDDFYFNLYKLEIAEMELKYEGGLSAYLEKLTKTTSGNDAYYLFKDIILASYGKRTDEGGFTKKDANGRPLRETFEEHPALGELIFQFMGEGGAEIAQEFIQGLFPPKLMKLVEQEVAKQKTTETVELPTTAPVLESSTEEIGGGPLLERDIESYSRAELLALPQDQFDHLAGKDPAKMDRELLVIAMQRKSQA